MEDILSAISTVGFPIFAFLLIFWYVNKKDEQQREELNALRETILKLNDTVVNNTAVILQFKDLISK